MDNHLYATKDVDKLYERVGSEYEKNIKGSLRVYTFGLSFIFSLLIIISVVIITVVINGFRHGFTMVSDSGFIIPAYVFFITVAAILVISTLLIEKSRKKLMSEGKSRSTMIFSEIYLLKNLISEKKRSFPRAFHFNILISFIREHISQIQNALTDSYYPLEVNNELDMINTIDETLKLISTNKLIKSNSDEVLAFLEKALYVYPLFLDKYETSAHVQPDISTQLNTLDKAIKDAAIEIQSISDNNQIVNLDRNTQVTNATPLVKNIRKSKFRIVLIDIVKKEVISISLILFFILSYLFALFMGFEFREATVVLFSILASLVITRSFDRRRD